MRIKEISVSLGNTSKISDITGILSEAGISVLALSFSRAGEGGMLRLLSNDHPAAKKALESKGFIVTETDVVVLEIADRPDGIHKIVKLIDRLDIGVEYMHAFPQREKNTLLVFRFEDMDAAAETLEDYGIMVTKTTKVYSL